jgi:predicted secreted hydrolase
MKAQHGGHGGKANAPPGLRGLRAWCTNALKLLLVFSVSSVTSVSSVFPALAAQPAEFPAVTPGKKIEFPRDRGAHPEYRIEWWYATGQLESERGTLGFQVTFFRLRNPAAEGNPSRFAPSQILFAHAALADPAKGKLLHDQRSARALAPVVSAASGDTDVRIDDWTFARSGAAYGTKVAANGFTLDLTLAPTQPPLLQGDAGFSRKGPLVSQASYYYSEPHLRVSGRVTIDGAAIAVRGVAWLDHEWSSEALAEDAVGWDWLGLNLDDGGALTAFRIRTRDGRTLWATATVRAANGATRAFAGDKVAMRPLRTWASPRSAAAYPVAMEIDVDGERWRIDPLMDDQELDARASVGTVYWEGAVRASGARAGRGYLELTGYTARVPF